MKLQPDRFRNHVQEMIDNGKKADLEMWIGHGLLIYSNFQELLNIWDAEYEEIAREL